MNFPDTQQPTLIFVVCWISRSDILYGELISSEFHDHASTNILKNYSLRASQLERESFLTMAEDIQALEYAVTAKDFIDQLLVERLVTGVCVICLESYNTVPANRDFDQPAVRLPCGHIFGSACIEAWLSPENLRNTCPLCRAILFPALQTYYTNDGSAADRAFMRIAEREPDWTIDDLRAYLRRRLEPDPLITEADVEGWWLEGADFSTHRSLRVARRELATWSQVVLYQRLSKNWQMPPLHPSTDPEGYATDDQMDESHVDALFLILVSLDAFDHPFWRVTTRGASTRQVFDLLFQEGHMNGQPGFGSVAPFLGQWTAFRNDGEDYFYGNRPEPDPDSAIEQESEGPESNDSEYVHLGSPRQSDAFPDDPMQDVIFSQEDQDPEDEDPEHDYLEHEDPEDEGPEHEGTEHQERSTPRVNRRGKRNVVIDSDDEL